VLKYVVVDNHYEMYFIDIYNVRLGYSLADLLHHCGEQLLPETEEDGTSICSSDTEDSHLILH